MQRFLNDKPLAHGSRRTLRHDFGLVTLDIAYVLPDDQGVYKCVAVNKAGEASTQAQLRCSGASFSHAFTSQNKCTFQRAPPFSTTQCISSHGNVFRSWKRHGNVQKRWSNAYHRSRPSRNRSKVCTLLKAAKWRSRRESFLSTTRG